jgi:hypothetical protein
MSGSAGAAIAAATACGATGVAGATSGAGIGTGTIATTRACAPSAHSTCTLPERVEAAAAHTVPSAARVAVAWTAQGSHPMVAMRVGDAATSAVPSGAKHSAPTVAPA